MLHRAAAAAVVDARAATVVRAEALRLLADQHPKSEELTTTLDAIASAKSIADTLRVAALEIMATVKPEAAVSHAARLLVGPDFGRLLPLAMLLGASFLLAVDTLCRTMASIEVPPGVLTALIGTPFFLWLFALARRTW